jgi:hypothetical protein
MTDNSQIQFEINKNNNDICVKGGGLFIETGYDIASKFVNNMENKNLNITSSEINEIITDITAPKLFGLSKFNITDDKVTNRIPMCDDSSDLTVLEWACVFSACNVIEALINNDQVNVDKRMFVGLKDDQFKRAIWSQNSRPNMPITFLEYANSDYTPNTLLCFVLNMTKKNRNYSIITDKRHQEYIMWYNIVILLLNKYPILRKETCITEYIKDVNKHIIKWEASTYHHEDVIDLKKNKINIENIIHSKQQGGSKDPYYYKYQKYKMKYLSLNQ